MDSGQEDPPREDSYLLSTEYIEPLLYFISLQIEVNQEPPYIIGRTEIDLRVKKPTKTIILHSFLLNIKSICYINQVRKCTKTFYRR
jgi:hypothetical protein